MLKKIKQIIVKYIITGVLLFFYFNLSNIDAEEYEYYAQWGSSGTNSGQFNSSTDICIDSNGNVYVTDTRNNRIQKFTSQGNFILEWNTVSSANDRFNYPRAIAVDSENNIYVADANNNRICKFTSQGIFIRQWGNGGSNVGQFNFPYTLAIDKDTNIYVSDFYNYRVQKFTKDGDFIFMWGTQGTGINEFSHICGFGIDSSNNLFIAQCIENRIQKFSSTGVLNRTEVFERGNGIKQFENPCRMTIDDKNDMYITDGYLGGNYRVQKLNANFEYITMFGSQGTNPGQMMAPSSISVAKNGDVYVCDMQLNRIQIFRPNSTNYILNADMNNFSNKLINYPNPFNPECYIPIENIGKNENIKVKVYNILGQVVREINTNNANNSVYWDGRDNFGKEVSSGMYFYEVVGNKNMHSYKKMLMLK